MKTSTSLLAAVLLLSIAAPALAEESLRYAVVSGVHYLPLIREELREAPADFLVAGRPMKLIDGSERGVMFAETVSLKDKQRVELGKHTPDGKIVTIRVERSAKRSPAAFTVDLEVMQHWAAYTPKASRLTAKSQAPARANAWQEVATSGGISLWQYYTPPDNMPSAETHAASDPDFTTDDELLPIYRREVQLGQLSPEALAKLESHDPEHRRLIAESEWWREKHVTMIRPGVPFYLSRSACELSKLGEKDHEASCTVRLDGSVERSPSHLSLKLRYQNQAQKKNDRRITPLGVEMLTDQWYFEKIKDPPIVDYPVGGSWCETTWAEKVLFPLCTNVAAYRLTRVSPDPDPAPTVGPTSP